MLGHAFEARGLKTPMARKDHAGGVDDQRVQESELPDAGGNLADLLSRMGPGVLGVGANSRHRRPLDPRRVRAIRSIAP